MCKGFLFIILSLFLFIKLSLDFYILNKNVSCRGKLYQKRNYITLTDDSISFPYSYNIHTYTHIQKEYVPAYT